MSNDDNFKIGEVDIRPMTQNDIRIVSIMEMEIFTDPWPENIFQELIDDPEVFPLIAAWRREVIGYAVYAIAYGEAQLANIAVAPKYRGKSIAKKLLKCILEFAARAGCENIFLDVRPSNDAAIGLYKAFGFMELYIRQDYYTSPAENALVMVKNLREEAD